MRLRLRGRAMTLTHKIYEELYSSLSDNETEKKYLSKRYQYDNGKYLIYAVSTIDKTRRLYFELSNEKISMFPIYKGITLTEVNLPEYSDEIVYGEVAQNRDSEGYIFEIIIDDIRKNIEKMTSKDNLQITVMNILRKWKEFFSADKSILLSPERQQGLYGELKYLDELIDQYGTISVNYWAGCKYETHDFYVNSSAVEVKTTSTKEPYKMHISSEYQLNYSEITGTLFIRFYALRKSDSTGEKLEDIVSAIKDKLSVNISMLYKFENNLEEYGYFSGVASKYITGYTIREYKNIQVDETLPCIDKSNLKNGISNCIYDLLVNACLDHILSDAEMNNMLMKERKDG
jgi:hypothetical protein